MANKIILKKTSTASKVPLSTDLEVGEIAVNLADQKLYSKNAGGTVVLVGSGISGAGDVVGGSSSTDNALARYDGTTGKLIQNSVVIVGDTGSITGVNALTAESLVVNNNATLGSSNTDTLDVRSRISSDLDPETNNAKDIGSSGRNWRDAFFGRTLSTVNIEVTGTTSFDGSQGTNGQVLTSAGTGNTPTWTTPTTGTVTSITTGTGLSGGTITTSGTVALANTAVTAGSYTNANITVDAQGRLTSATSGTAGGVTSFNTRTGAVTLSSGDVTTALGFTPYNSTNPSAYITQAQARTSVSFTAGSGAYNSTTGVFTIPTNTNQLTNGAGFTTNTGTVTSVTGGTYLTGGTITTSGTLAVDATSTNTVSKVVARDASGNFSAGTITASLSGNATTATTLATGRTIAITGDLTYTSGSFNGSGNVTGTGTLANSGVTAGSYTNANITVDSKGRVTLASSGTGGGVSSITGTANEIDVSSSTGAVTLSLPATINANINGNATTASNGGVTSVNGSTGAVTISSPKIIQTQQFIYTTQSAISVLAGVLSPDIAGFSVTITPTSASNKILVNATIGGCTNFGAADQRNIWVAIYRNGAEPSVIGVANGSAVKAHGCGYTSQVYGVSSIPIQFFDTPATTSPVTYTVRVSTTSNGNGIVYINRGANPSSFRAGSTISTITVQEIITP